MNDVTVKNDEAAIYSIEKSTAISTVGYLCLAATWWMTGMLIAGWFSPATTPALASGTIYAMGSALLIIIGILSLIFGHRMLDSIIFLSTAGLFFSLQNANLAGLDTLQTTTVTGGYIGWYALIWAVFFCYVWIAAFRPKTGAIRMLFLLILWLGALAAAIGGWSGSRGFEVLSGYLLLITAILAFIVSAEDLLGHSLGKAWRTREKRSTSPQAHPGLAS